MKISKNVLQKMLSCYVVVLFLVSSGFTKINDIETAIIVKDFKAAKSLAEDFLAKNPVHPDAAKAKYYLGLSELGLVQYDEARIAFNQVLEVNPSKSLYDKAWIGIIDSLGMEGKFEEDLAQAEKFLKDRPDSEFLSVIYLKIGRANLKLSRWGKAEEYLKKVINEFPKTFEAHTARQLLAEKRFFSIQVGSFLDQARAIALVEELKNKNEYAYLVETQDHEGRAFYRVRVGQLKSIDEAHEMRQRLSEQGYPAHIYP
jgi:tetratricopeptide (TPR) repeat protein